MTAFHTACSHNGAWNYGSWRKGVCSKVCFANFSVAVSEASRFLLRCGTVVSFFA